MTDVFLMNGFPVTVGAIGGAAPPLVLDEGPLLNGDFALSSAKLGCLFGISAAGNLLSVGGAEFAKFKFYGSSSLTEGTFTIMAGMIEDDFERPGGGPPRPSPSELACLPKVGGGGCYNDSALFSFLIGAPISWNRASLAGALAPNRVGPPFAGF